MGQTTPSGHSGHLLPLEFLEVDAVADSLSLFETYFKRSDLSPDGSLLIYFAQKIIGRSKKDTEYTYAWTANSRPPFLTALALWPKGDCWHGGGSLKNSRIVLLNHKPNVARAHPKHKPHRLLAIPNPAACGEDDPIQSFQSDRNAMAAVGDRMEGRESRISEALPHDTT